MQAVRHGNFQREIGDSVARIRTCLAGQIVDTPQHLLSPRPSLRNQYGLHRQLRIELRVEWRVSSGLEVAKQHCARRIAGVIDLDGAAFWWLLCWSHAE